MPCNISKILKLSKRYNLKVIEDCAQSHFQSIKINMWVILVMRQHLVFFQLKI